MLRICSGRKQSSFWYLNVKKIEKVHNWKRNYYGYGLAINITTTFWKKYWLRTGLCCMVKEFLTASIRKNVLSKKWKLRFHSRICFVFINLTWRSGSWLVHVCCTEMWLVTMLTVLIKKHPLTGRSFWFLILVSHPYMKVS